MVTLYFNLARFQTFFFQNKDLLDSMSLDENFFGNCVILVFNHFGYTPPTTLIHNYLDRRLDLQSIVQDRYDDYYFQTKMLPPPSREITRVYELVLYGILALLTDVYSTMQNYRLQTTSILNLDIKGRHGELVI